MSCNHEPASTSFIPHFSNKLDVCDRARRLTVSRYDVMDERQCKNDATYDQTHQCNIDTCRITRIRYRRRMHVMFYMQRIVNCLRHFNCLVWPVMCTAASEHKHKKICAKFSQKWNINLKLSGLNFAYIHSLHVVPKLPMHEYVTILSKGSHNFNPMLILLFASLLIPRIIIYKQYSAGTNIKLNNFSLRITVMIGYDEMISKLYSTSIL
jgi:hypothetical protein